MTKQKISSSTQKALAGKTGPAGPKGDPGAPGSALGYAYIDKEGKLDPSRSKGVVGVSAACTVIDEHPCSSPVAPEGIKDLCFKLEFTPHVLVATPSFGRSYAPDEPNVFNAKIPSRLWSGVYGGCPTGYEDAELRAFREGGGGVFAGIYVVFN